MDYKFSDSLKNMKPSEIRELLKYARAKNFISLSGGMPSPDSFPYSDLKEIINEVIDNYGSLALQYGNTGGLNELRQEIGRLVKETESFTANEMQILVTSGSQQGLYELAKVMANPGDAIITEEPTYVGAISAFDANKLDMHSVPMDDNGLLTEELEAEIVKLSRSGKKPKFIYTIPTFQNPTGLTMSLERRKHLLEISYKYEIPVVEDNPYGELRFEGSRVPSIKSLDTQESVIYLGTFSKIMCPGFRIGFTIAPESYTNRANLLKQALDLSSSTFSQYVAWLYLKRDVIKRMIPRAVSMYRKKKDAMLKALEQNFPEGSTWSRPKGGMFIWAKIHPKINTTEMLAEAVQEGVSYVSGNSFSPSRSQGNAMRLNFTFPTEEQISEGISKISRIIERRIEVMKTA
ncbi:MAG TPA: PLP-dependent aminotransferase family protein [Thermoplasmataceae archaeon]|nr:PLP-dependent aminotransferase family protein [Thermoplasmatales archaeon AK]HLH86628.1 PLP-dependent aminotransferase family protein [Thermoplasmataceae archaeon]